MPIASLGASAGVDREQRIDFPRLRRERLERAQAALRASDLGALLLFDPNDIRYTTSTHILADAARDGRGPAMIEALTYRFVGHFRDPGAYRPDGELESWRQHDPLVVARRRLTTELAVQQGELDRIEAEVAAELDTIEQASLAAPFPDTQTVPTELKEAS